MRIRLTRLQKSYGSKIVLDVPSAELSSGLITGIIGPNGAGKTTLMNSIAGLDTLDQGEVAYEQENGQFSSEVPTKAITMLFQTPYMLRTNVEKNIAYPLKLRHLERETIDRRVQNLMDELDIGSLAKNMAWRLSGGETQKVALARAIALKPQVLLLDEPTSNIDNASVAVIERTLLKERDMHLMTSVIISHNLAQIRRLCDEIIFMDKGCILEQGPAERLLSQPQNPRTQAFIAGALLL